MKVYVTKRYWKRNRENESPAVYRAEQRGGVGTDVHATIMMTPVLKKHRDLREGILKHETEEIKAWGRGSTRAHRIASSKEPVATRKLGGERAFWKEIERRGKKKRR